MAEKTKTREITLVDEGGAFAAFFKKFTHDTAYDFDSLSLVRKLLSNEKARMLHTIKTKKPHSLYHLAKLLQRDFKSVSEDIKLLERFGCIDLIAEKSGKRERLRPVVVVDTIALKIKV